MTKVELLQGDCREVLRQVKAKSVDVVVCSPPYNINTKYSTYRDNLTEAQYLDFIYQMAAAVHRVLQPDGSFFVNIAGSPSKPHLPFRIVGLLAGNLFKLQNTFIWVKSIAIKKQTYGHFTPINSTRFVNHNFEYIFHFTKTGFVELDRLAIGVPYMDQTNVTRWQHKNNTRCQGNVWYIPHPTKQKKSKHPATFPTRLPIMCIKLHGKSRATVLDPFCGTGATLLAARKLRMKKAIGIDIDQTYLKLAERRCLARSK